MKLFIFPLTTFAAVHCSANNIKIGNTTTTRYHNHTTTAAATGTATRATTAAAAAGSDSNHQHTCTQPVNASSTTSTTSIKNLFALVSTATAVSAAVDIPPSPVTEAAVEATTVDQKTSGYLDAAAVAQRRQQRRYSASGERAKSVATLQQQRACATRKRVAQLQVQGAPESEVEDEVEAEIGRRSSDLVNACANSDIDDDSETEIEPVEAAPADAAVVQELTLAGAERVRDDAFGDFEAQFELDAELERHANDLIHIDQVFEELRQKMEVLSVQNQYQGQFGVIGSSKVKGECQSCAHILCFNECVLHIF